MTEYRSVRVFIKVVPPEHEIDGVRLDNMTPGSVREVSANVGAWLIANGYAVAEMRHQPDDEHSGSGHSDYQYVARDRRRHQR